MLGRDLRLSLGGGIGRLDGLTERIELESFSIGGGATESGVFRADSGILGTSGTSGTIRWANAELDADHF